MAQPPVLPSDWDANYQRYQFRALYRIFEFTINNGDNYFATHEWTAYVFDAVPMVLFVVLFSLYHPSKYLPPTHMSLNHAYKRLW